jgi:DNA-binding CsgD family transcriptional regulator
MSQGKEANLGSGPRPRLNKRGVARAKPVDVHRRADARPAQIGSPDGRPGGAAASRQPVLVVNVDVEASSPTDESRWRWDARLVPPSGGAMPERRSDAYNGEVTAVVILRDATASHVASCVRAATRGNGLIDPELFGRLLPERDAGPLEPVGPQLDEREYEVLRMLADGESTRGIAERLSYSERTVKNIVRGLLVKLKCKTRAHAVALAARQGVI